MRLSGWGLALVLGLALGSLVAACGTSAPGAGVGAVGQGVVLHQDGNRAVVSLLAVKDHTRPAGKLSSPPRNGMFVVCDVSVRVTSGSWHVSPLYFRYHTPSGDSYTFLDGNGRVSGYDEPPLDPVTLHAGQQIHGYVVFDVPKGTAGADVELYVGSALFRWNI
jgi:hypothetical protein